VEPRERKGGQREEWREDAGKREERKKDRYKEERRKRVGAGRKGKRKGA